MIKLTRLKGNTLLVNENFIEVAEEAPDTVVTMQNGHRYVVKEKVDEIIAKVREFNYYSQNPPESYKEAVKEFENNSVENVENGLI